MSLPTGTPTLGVAAAHDARRVPARPAARLPRGVVVALIVGLASILWFALHGFVSSPELRIAGGAAALMLPALCACWFSVGVSRRDEIDAHDRTGWVFIGLSTGAAAIFALVMALPSDARQAGAAPAIGAGSHVTLLLLASVGVLHWVRRRSLTATVGTLLDLSCVAVLAYVVSWKSLLSTTILGTSLGQTSNVDTLTMYATPMLGTLLLVAVVTVLSQVGHQELRGTELLATFGIGGIVATDLGMALRGSGVDGITAAWHHTMTGADTSITVVLGWVLGMTGIAFSGSLRRAAPEVTSHVPLMARSTSWELLVALVPFALLGGVLATSAASAGTESRVLTNGVLCVLGVLLLLRCTLVATTAIRAARSSETDHLTSALSHRELQERLPRMVDDALSIGRPVSMLAIDLDDFGVLNDTVSHAEGDRYLREVAWTIRGAIGPDALLFRVGGDEFAVLLDGCDSVRATAIAEAVAHDVRCIRNEHVHDPSLTIGIAAVPEHGADAQELLQVATGTLYWGKLSGKASITCYDPDVVTVLSTEERVQAMEQNARLRAVLALARALDARDAYTARHSENVSRYAVAIAAEMGWDKERLELLRVAGLLHDVGKIGVRDSTLRKSSKLAEDEWAEMQTHPALGASMIAGVAPEEIIPWVISHHERMDGCGYPHELGGEDIPDGARILAVADTFDAMTSSRSYRPALSPLRAIDEIVKGAGPQFDPEAVRAFLRALRANTIDVQQVAELARTAPAQEQHPGEPGHDVALGEFVTLDPEFVGAAAVELFVPADEDLGNLAA